MTAAKPAGAAPGPSDAGLNDEEKQYLEDNIATVAFYLGEPGATLSVRSDKSALTVDPGEVLKEISRRLMSVAQPARGFAHLWVCTGCGTRKSMEQIKGETPHAIACCPERHMAPPPPSPTAPAQAWQPIATAPKDGTSFLVCAGNWLTVAHWHRVQQCLASNGPVYSPYPADEQPTHWMPLPAAPSVSSTQLGGCK